MGWIQKCCNTPADGPHHPDCHWVDVTGCDYPGCVRLVNHPVTTCDRHIQLLKRIAEMRD